MIKFQAATTTGKEFFRLTKKEYQGKGMFLHQRRKTKVWVKNADANTKEALKRCSDHFRFRVATWEAMRESHQRRCQVIGGKTVDELLFAFYGAKRFRNLNFKVLS